MIMVSGANGMLGKNLIEALREYKHRFGDVVGVRREDCDFTNENLTKVLLDSENPRVLIHCAAQSDNSKGPSYVANLQMVHNAAKHFRGTQFVFISSSAVFGNYKNDPFVENSPKNPTSLYGLSKLHGEDIVRHFAAQHDYTPLIIRPCAIVGPHLTHGLLYDLIKKVKNSCDGDGLELWGNEPGSTKPFVHVNDIISLLAFNCLAHKSYGRGMGGTLNFAPPDTMSVLDVAKRVMKRLGNRRIIWNPSRVPQGDNPYFRMTTSTMFKPWQTSYEAIERAIEENV